MKHLTSIVIILFLIITKGYTQGTVVSKGISETDLTPHLLYYEDLDNSLTFKSALQSVEEGKFTQSENEGSLNFGHINHSIWVFFELTSEQDIEEVLQVACPYIHYIDFWEFEEGKWKQHVSTGKKRPNEMRGGLKPRDFAWKLFLKKGKKKRFLLKFKGTTPMLLPISIKTIDYYLSHRTTVELVYGLYFGILLIMFLYNGILYFNLKSKTYLYYTFSILCTMLIFSGSNGFTQKYIIPSPWQLTYYTSEIFMFLIMIPTSLFAIHFLELEKYSKFCYKLLYFWVFVSIPLLIISVITENSGLASQVIGLFAPCLLLSGVLALKNGNPFAQFYIIAWAVYLIGGIGVTGRNVGLFENNFITQNGAEIGSAIEVCLLAIALASKYRAMKREKDQLAKDHLHLIKSQNQQLESQVQERTIILDNTIDELNATLEDLNTKTILLEKNNQSITSSINYAQLIQQSILPKDQELKQLFSDHFTMYKPKDIVGGDFIFCQEQNGVVILAVTDCTGHGVPGGFMSMVGHNILYEIVKVHEILKPDLILKMLDSKMYLRLNIANNDLSDGMDIAIVALDKKNNTLSFAGGKNNLIIINKANEIEVYKGAKRSINDQDRMHIPFESTTIELESIKYAYMYTDGFQDQFGEKTDTKYFAKRLNSFLATHSNESGNIQQKKLEKEFNDWKGSIKQLDDVCIAGFKP